MSDGGAADAISQSAQGVVGLLSICALREAPESKRSTARCGKQKRILHEGDDSTLAPSKLLSSELDFYSVR